MASVIPAGAGTAIPLEMVPIINGKMLWYEERLDIIVNLLTTLHMSIYRKEFRNTLKMHAEMNTDNLFKYYIKGGNAIALLKGLPFSLDNIVFPSDFDYSLIINPELPLDRYNAIQASIIGNCLYNLKLFCDNSGNWSPFLELLTEGYNTPPNRVIINDKTGVYMNKNGKMVNMINVSRPNIHLNRILDTVKHWEFPNECPFECVIYPNMIIPDSRNQRNPFGKLLNIGVVILRLRNTVHTELYNMSFVLRNEEVESNSYKKLKRDWDITQLVLYDNTIPMRGTRLLSYVYDPLSAYINQKIAFNANTRSNKRSKRSVRMARLKHMLKNTHRNGNARNTRKRAIRNRYPEFANILTNNI